MPRRTNSLALAMRMLTREWHAGELRILIAALLVAVGSVSAVGFFTDRVEQAMAMQAAELLAADSLMHSSEPIGEAKVDKGPLIWLDHRENLELSKCSSGR